jgi:dihydroxyacetone kinase-like protein
VSSNQAFLRRLIEAVSQTVIDHADELTQLDSAIGDGDHGANMKRGFEAVLADIDALSTKPLQDALKAIGTLLVMKVGGASGPLYGTLSMSLGKALAEPVDRTGLAEALSAAIVAVKARGKSDVGQKTMLDVLATVQEAIAAGGSASTVAAQAQKAAEATSPDESHARARILSWRKVSRPHGSRRALKRADCRSHRRIA